MKKTFWSLAALMLMAAPMMTSCSNDLDEVAPVEEQSNVVTITIAPPVAEPETRVAMDGNLVTGWELNDEVTLYKVTVDNEMPGMESATLSGTGVTFKCIDAAAGTFSGDLGSGTLDQYTFAVYGAEAISVSFSSDGVALVPKTMCSENLKDVVVMAAFNSGDGYTMEVVNNVMKVKNGTAADIEVALSSQGYGTGTYHVLDYRVPLSCYGYDKNSRDFAFFGPTVSQIPSTYKGWANAKPFTLKKGVDSYVTMGMFGHNNDQWGIAKENGDQVVARKAVGTSKRGKKGKLFNAGTYTGTVL